MQEPVEPSTQTKAKKSALASVEAAETVNTRSQIEPRQGTNRNQWMIEPEAGEEPIINIKSYINMMY